VEQLSALLPGRPAYDPSRPPGCVRLWAYGGTGSLILRPARPGWRSRG